MNLTDILDDPALLSRFVEQGSQLIDAEVASKSGFSGMALKTGFATVKRLKPGVVPELLRMLLPHFAPAVAPHVDAAQEQGDVAAYFRGHDADIAEAMLQVTDARAAKADNAVLKKIYTSLRPQALQHTKDAMPRVGDLLASFLAPE